MLTKKDRKKKESIVLSALVKELYDSVSYTEAVKMADFWLSNKMIADSLYHDLIKRLKEKYND